VLLACSHGGWLGVPINWHFAADEVAYVLSDSGATALIVDNRFADLAERALIGDEGTDLRAHLVMGDGASYEQALAESSADEPADQMLGGVMFYTSGTTGRPKGVRNTSFQLGTPPEVMQLMAASMGSFGIPERGRTLLCGPHYHSAQWAFSFLPLVAGSSLVMQDRFVAEETLRLIDDHEITNVHLVPTQFVRMLRVPEECRSAYRGDSLAFVLHGAAPCAPEVKRAMIEWWGPKITEYYGATEGGVVSVISSAEWLERPGSVGRPMPIVDVRIVTSDGEVAGPGEEGVIHVKSLIGQDFEYLNAPEKTAEAHSEPGYMTMGDIGYIDDEGFLFLSDRKIDMIISGGVNIYPAEIEGVLVAHPDVVDVAVIGVPDEEFGEAVKAIVQLDDSRPWSDDLQQELVDLCRSQLAGYKVPRSFDVIHDMPRSAAGKLVKRSLRQPYWEDAGRRI
jgi:long-chain acyl-CoA synthetase